MDGFLVILALFLGITSLIIPWVNFTRIGRLKDEIRFLEQRLDTLYKRYRALTLQQETKEIKDKKETKKKPKQYAPVTTTTSIPKSSTATKPPSPKTSFEQQFGARMPVWIGGIAIALAGLFLVKYSVENQLLSPTIRVTLGALLGLSLLGSAQYIISRPHIANYTRIAQSLAGAGIAILYIVFFASSRLYELIPVLLGFFGMAATTAIALIASLRHGAPIAMLGMAGGFLTPALMSTGSGDAFSLFTYLYFTASGLLIVIRETKWWWLSLPTIALSLLWALVWIFTQYTPEDTTWLALFLLAMSGTIILSSKTHYEEHITEKRFYSPCTLLNIIGLGGTIMLMGILAAKGGFGFLEWGMFWLLSASSIALSYFNNRLYGFTLWLSLAVNSVMLLNFSAPETYIWPITLIAFASIYLLSGYVFVWKKKALPAESLTWIALGSTASLAYFVLAYYHMRHDAYLQNIPLFWGLVATALAALSSYVTERIYHHFKQHPFYEYMLTVTFVTATALLSLGLTIELKSEFLSLAFAAEMFFVSLLTQKIALKNLRIVAAVLAAVFAYLLLPQILLIIQVSIYSLIEAKIHLQETLPIVDWPVVQLGLPAALFFGSAYYLQKRKEDWLVHLFEASGILLTALMAYYMLRNSFHSDQQVLFIKAGMIERNVITNVLFLYGLLCFSIGAYWSRILFTKAGTLLCVVALFRIIYFDVLLYNPLWTHTEIKGALIINTLLLPYGLPLLWSIIAYKHFIPREPSKLLFAISSSMLLMLFALVSTNIRYLFQGAYLDSPGASNGEIYSYSVAWLILGIALVFWGVLKKNQTLRYASLAIILFTVGKVFLYDASELEGLYRVFSFFGLGLSLIGLSYFYTRFVFKEKTGTKKI